MGVGAVCRGGVAAAWMLAMAAAPATAAVEVIGSQVTMHWAPASGPVAGYALYVARDGGPYVRESATTANRCASSSRRSA
jgi:hypothetical protein